MENDLKALLYKYIDFCSPDFIRDIFGEKLIR